MTIRNSEKTTQRKPSNHESGAYRKEKRENAGRWKEWWGGETAQMNHAQDAFALGHGKKEIRVIKTKRGGRESQKGGRKTNQQQDSG